MLSLVMSLKIALVKISSHEGAVHKLFPVAPSKARIPFVVKVVSTPAPITISIIPSAFKSADLGEERVAVEGVKVDH